MSWRPVFFKYSDSGRAAIGLTVEAWRDGTLLRATVTDGQGCAGDCYSGERLVIRRGVHKYGLEPVIPEVRHRSANHYELQPAHWPEKLRRLREQLHARRKLLPAPRTPQAKQHNTSVRELKENLELVRDELIDAANRTLQALRQTGDLDRLTMPQSFSDKTDSDNPQIVIGTLLSCMAISRLFTIHEGLRKWDTELPNDVERDRLHATKTGIHHAMLWLRRRQHPSQPGYFRRWQQTVEDSRDLVNDWKAEPSLDEYSGLLLALSWLPHVATRYNFGLYNQWESAVSNDAASMLTAISNYLVDTRGWLVRPMQRDLTARGPDLVVNAWPLYLILAASGRRRFRNAKPFRLADDEKTTIDNSERSLRELDSQSALGKTYKETVKLAKAIKDIDRWSKLASAVAQAAAGFAAFGLGGFASFAAVANLLGSRLAAINPLDMLDVELWELAGEALGPPAAVGAGSYNIPIYDRFCLAASWSGDAANAASFRKRAGRPYGGDTNGWQSLGIAARIWMGVDLDPEEVADRLRMDADARMPNDGSLPEGRLPNIEGFILGWSIIALALDFDPEIRWEDCLAARNSWDAPSEIPTTVLPRFRMLWRRLRINETREHGDAYAGEEPYLWIIPILLTERETSLDHHFLPTYQSPAFVHAATGDVIDVNKTFNWGTGPIEVMTHLLVIAIAWEADFTSAADRDHALTDALAGIETELDRWVPGERSLGELSGRIGSMLRWQLPHYYRYAEAQPGYRWSDDDFVGADVIHATAAPDSAGFESHFEVRLHRQPKPHPRFTDLTLDATVSFKNVG